MNRNAGRSVLIAIAILFAEFVILYHFANARIATAVFVLTILGAALLRAFVLWSEPKGMK